MADALAAAVERLRTRAEEAEPAGEQPKAPLAPAARLPAHKHSMSWFARMKIKRKQRRTR
jgi:hypothetical protein